MSEVVTKRYFPLRPIQRRLMDAHFRKAKSTMMNVGALLKLPSSLDPEMIAEVLNEILETHDIFRCRLEFHPETNDLCQTFDTDPPEIEVKKISDEEFEKRIEKLKEPYEIIENPLFRIYVFETPTAGYMYTDFYHAIMDGTSVALLFVKELDIRYRGRFLNHTPGSYARYVLEESMIPEEELAEGHAYWRSMLLNFDRQKNLPTPDIAGGKAWSKGEYKTKIKNVSEEYFHTHAGKENIFFLAAALLTLSKVTGADEAIVNRVHNGRVTAREYRIMGLMMDQFPCYWDFHDDLKIEEFLSALEGQVQSDMMYRKSLDVVYNEGLAEDCPGFIFQKNIAPDHVMIGDSQAIVIDMPPNDMSAAENSLDIEVRATETGIYDLILDYDAGRYSDRLIKNFAATFDKITLNMQSKNILISKILHE